MERFLLNKALLQMNCPVERGINRLQQVSSSFTIEDCFDGKRFEIGDFHAAMKF